MQYGQPLFLHSQFRNDEGYRMAYSIKVVRQILILFVEVRILVGQQKSIISKKMMLFLCSHKKKGTPKVPLYDLLLKTYYVLLISVDTIQIFKSNLQTFNEALFSFTQPYTWIVLLFIWFVCSFRISQLALQIPFILFVIV